MFEAPNYKGSKSCRPRGTDYWCGFPASAALLQCSMPAKAPYVSWRISMKTRSRSHHKRAWKRKDVLRHHRR